LQFSSFTSFYRIYNPLVPQTRFSPLSLQFSSSTSVANDQAALEKESNKNTIAGQATGLEIMNIKDGMGQGKFTALPRPGLVAG
jgi:hypothetical protein